jgi:protein-S-isoprenylcysteine O-methyltransferase Ste14
MEKIITEFFTILNYYIKFDWEIILSIAMIIICPVTWNLVARYEFYTKKLSTFCGDNRLAADIFAHCLIEMGIFRNYLFVRVMRNQLKTEYFDDHFIILEIIGYLILVCGFHLTIFAYYRLGIHGIYYGDYFGVLCKEMVTAFPFSILENPLYVGSTMMFFGSSILYRSPAGIVLTICAWIMYQFASILENPMTPLIYSPENIEKVRLYYERKEKERELKQENQKQKSQ